jgi:hypothetical protein
MKSYIISYLLVVVALTSFAQINFERGYFIDNHNQRFECLIKNIDWKNNPVQFEYKLTGSDKAENGNINTVKEFGITDFSRFVRADVKIDVSPADLDNLSIKPNPEWVEERLFLNVLVEGKAKLYYYEKGKLVRFFYSLSDTSIIQLIYKEYYASENQIAENFKYREQLWNDVRCLNAGLNSVENLRYNKTELERYFKKHNETEESTSLVYSDKKKRDSFQLRLTPGLNYSWVTATNAVDPNLFIDLGYKTNYRIGIEAQFILPFNKNKWGIVFDPSYQYFNSSGQNSSETVNINYQSIEFPIGLRHIFFMNENLTFFVDALFITNFSFDFNSTISNLDVRTDNSFAIGGGAGFKKISAEIRYSTDRNLLSDYVYWNTDYRRISLILGFRIL